MAKVLVVDDAVVIREKLKLILKNSGHEVVEASNGIQASLMYQKHHPDIVTLDITMPGSDGIEGIKKIKEKDPDAVIIMISAMSQKEVILEALTTGAVNFILKPFDSVKVNKAIDDALVKYNKTGETDNTIVEEMKKLKRKHEQKESMLKKMESNH